MENQFKLNDPVLVLHSNEIGFVAQPPKMIRGEYWYVIQTGQRKAKYPESAIGHPPSEDATLPDLAQEGASG